MLKNIFGKVPRLNASYIQRKCGITSFCFREITSTNEIIKQYARQNAPEFTMLVAESQSAGKGRGEHSFFSPLGCGVYISILLRGAAREFTAGEITAAAGVAACEAIEACSGGECQIKWMNDVYINGKKVAGILAEAGTDEKGERYTVVGVGFNISVPNEGYPKEFAARADAIYHDRVPKFAREKLAIAFFKRLTKRLEPGQGGAVYRAYRQRLFVLGRTVVFEGREAVATELSEDFRLELTFADGERLLLDSREISLPQK